MVLHQEFFLLSVKSYMEKTTVRTKCYLIEESLWELLEALGAHKALLVVKFPVTVDYLLSRGEATLAALAHGVGQSIGHVAKGKMEKYQNQYTTMSIKKIAEQEEGLLVEFCLTAQLL